MVVLPVLFWLIDIIRNTLGEEKAIPNTLNHAYTRKERYKMVRGIFCIILYIMDL